MHNIPILLTSTLLHIHEHTVGEESVLQHFWEVLAPSLEITGWVILMMTLIELVNISSAGKLLSKLHYKPFLQVLVACLLGAIPGCAGGFAVVSMFTHNLLSFGALVAGMLATFGDESFFLFAKDPKTALLLTAVLLVIGAVVGNLLNVMGKRWNFKLENHGFELHDTCQPHEHESQQLHAHAGEGFLHKINHFFREHLWEHVVRKHLLSVFLWSFGVLLFLHVLSLYVDIETIMESQSWAKYAMLGLAVLVGFIPESGPNLIFIMMFLEGNLPFALLLANSISQNGHAGLPLLAQSRRNFLIVKTLTMLLGFLVGLLLL